MTRQGAVLFPGGITACRLFTPLAISDGNLDGGKEFYVRRLVRAVGVAAQGSSGQGCLG